MRYESKAARHMLRHPDGRKIQFSPGPKINVEGDRFGTLDSGDAGVQAFTRLTEAQLDAFIQGSESFRAGRVGKSGIWPEAKRVEAETGLAREQSELSVVRGMNEAQLRGVIAASGVAVPGEGASKEDLEGIAADCIGGRLKPGDVPETTAGDEPESKPAKKKR